MPDKYDLMAAQYGGSADPSQVLDKYDLAAKQFGGTLAPAAPAAPTTRQAPQPVSGSNLVRAAGAGANCGIFADMLGLNPIDAATNALDLVKAGVGVAYNEGKKFMTGKPSVPPDWTMPTDHSTVPGSSDWIVSKLNGAGLGGMVNNPVPASPLARVVYAGGRAAGASIVPNPEVPLSAFQQLGNVLKGGLAGTTAGAVGEFAPDWAPTAGMMPALAGRAVVAGAGRAAFGSNATRAATAQRMQDLNNGGIDNPSLGLATGSPLVMGVENLLSKIPGSVGLYQNANAANFAGMRDKVADLRDTASQRFGRGLVGSDIQDDLSTLLPRRISQGYEGLLNQTMSRVGADTRIPVAASIKASTDMSTPLPGAENTSDVFILPRMRQIASGLTADDGGSPAQTITSSIAGANGQPITINLPATPSLGVPFGAVRDLRTRVGQETESPAIIGTPAEGQYKQLYGALSDDLANGVGIADMNAGIFPGVPGSATQSWNRSNALYSAGMDRIARVQPFANKVAPEQAFSSLLTAASGNPSTLLAVKKSVSPDTRASFAATLLDEMGGANSGHQNAAGDVFSPETYLTQYDKYAPGRDQIFSGFANAPEVRDGVDDVANAASMLRDSSKIWANPSGSGANLAASSTLGSMIGSLGSGFLHAVGAGSTLGAGNLASRWFLLNPDFVNKAATPTQSAPYMDWPASQQYLDLLLQGQQDR